MTTWQYSLFVEYLHKAVETDNGGMAHRILILLETKHNMKTVIQRHYFLKHVLSFNPYPKDHIHYKEYSCNKFYRLVDEYRTKSAVRKFYEYLGAYANIRF